MGPTQAIKTCLAKSFQFKGRASRSEFWWFAGPAYLLTAMLLSQSEETYVQPFWEAALNAAFFFPMVGLSLLLTVGIRRLHDVGINGYWWPLMMFLGTMYFQYAFLTNWPLESFFLILIIMLTPFVLLVAALMTAMPSAPQSNKYGPNPTEVPS